jgi:hypothetical protein
VILVAERDRLRATGLDPQARSTVGDLLDARPVIAARAGFSAVAGSASVAVLATHISWTIPPNTLKAGMIVRMVAFGRYTNTTGGALNQVPTIVLSTLNAARATFSQAATASGVAWMMEGLVSFQQQVAAGQDAVQQQLYTQAVLRVSYGNDAAAFAGNQQSSTVAGWAFTTRSNAFGLAPLQVAITNTLTLQTQLGVGLSQSIETHAAWMEAM